MRTKRLGLTPEQRKRGVIFSSQLVNSQTNQKGMIHEVFYDTPATDKALEIALLLDTRAFDGKIPEFEPIYDENIIRQ